LRLIVDSIFISSLINNTKIVFMKDYPKLPPEELIANNMCPECLAPLRFEDGCYYCPECGYSACGSD